jgi:hypothetical protein
MLNSLPSNPTGSRKQKRPMLGAYIAIAFVEKVMLQINIINACCIARLFIVLALCSEKGNGCWVDGKC